MAINRFDTPARSIVRETFVPQSVPLPYAELQNAIQQRQQRYNETEELLDDSNSILLNVKALPFDKPIKDEILTEYEAGFESLVEEVGGDLSQAGRAAKVFARDIQKDLTRGKLAAIQNRYIQAGEYNKKVDEILKDAPEKAEALKAIASQQTALRGLENEDGSYNPYTTLPVSKSVDYLERAIELTKGMAESGQLGSAFLNEYGQIEYRESEGITYNKALNTTLSIMLNDNPSQRSLSQDYLINSVSRPELSNPEVVDKYEQILDSYLSQLGDGNVARTIKSFIEGAPEENRGEQVFKAISMLKKSDAVAQKLYGVKPKRTIRNLPKEEASGNPFGQYDVGAPVPIEIKTNPLLLNSPLKVKKAIEAEQSNLKKAQDQLDTFMAKNGIDNIENPVVDGVDHSSDLNRLLAIRDQIKYELNDLQEGRRKAMEQSGVKEVDVEQLEGEIEAAYYEAVNDFANQNGRPPSSSEKKFLYDKAEELALDNAEGKNFNKYRELLQKDSLPKVQTIGISPIIDNKIEETVQKQLNIILGNFGKGDFTQKIYELTTDTDGEAIISEEEAKSFQKINLDGLTYNPNNNQLEIVFQAKDGNNDYLGRFSTKAPTGLIPMLVKEGKTGFLRVALKSVLTSIDNSFSRDGNILKDELGGQGIKYSFARREATMGDPLRQDKPYSITFPYRSKDGDTYNKIERFSTQAEALKRIESIVRIKFQDKENQ